jgi:excisionase family DNA binding protein
MVQGYYTLPEAAQYLGMSVDELKQMAQKGKIRSFQDRGTLRFRTQDIQELARKRGGTSDPDLALGDAPPPKSSSSKKAPASPKSPRKQEPSPDVFSFDMDSDKVDLASDLPIPGSAAKSSKPGSKSKKPAGSDSDVRLVADGSDVTFSVPRDSKIKPDSDVKISPDPLKPRTGVHPPSSSAKRPSQLAIGSGTQPKSKTGSSPGSRPPGSPRPATPPHTPVDSGVRLVPMDSDSDVKLLGSSDDVPLGEGRDLDSTDSNVRLEKVSLPPSDSSEEAMNLTEEINLDEELRQHQEKAKDGPPTKLKAKSELKLPTSSPFELSDSDLDLPSELKKAGPKTPKKAKPTPGESSDFDITAKPSKRDSSSDFDLTPASDDSSSDFQLELSDDHEQVLGHEQSTELTSATSGISLNNPADQGISLESHDESSEFDLSLDAQDTPKPAKSSPAADSSEFELGAHKTPKPQKEGDDSDAEFDLSLEPDADGSEQGDSSEFELSLDDSGEGTAGTSDSDSEFELTLDDSGNLAALDESPPQVKSKKKPAAAASEEQDIFDTDFDVPSLDGSDDEATVADSELESSDFDLALDDSELANEEESGSQVVALDEEDAATVSDDDAAVVDDVDVEEESSDFQDLDADVEVDADDEVDVDVDGETVGAGKTRTVVQEKLVPAAPWGVMPVVFMLPCVVIMLVVGLLGLELVQTNAGMKPPGVLTMLLADTFNTKVTLK